MEQMPLLLDAAVIILILVFAGIGYHKGFVMEALSFLPMLAAMIAVKFLTPVMGVLLRKTPFFGTLANSIGKSMQLDTVIGNAAMHTQTEIIQNMHLPDFLKDALLENNNPVIYNLLDVQGLKEYIAGFLANVCINIVSVIIVFVVVLFLARFLLKALNLVSKLPILNFFNRSCGLLVGGIKGLFWIWLIAMGITFLQCNDKMLSFFQVLNQSVIALFLYENNILLFLILKIFT
ncbi:CvpA family protein [Anaerotignum propionicum]|uniref:Colicin V production protein n=1 Tax=Anaerotignum propionicum DSM 1682 TaxID=991789 RepID=A0A0X8VBP1_ANAPI|nr:CvpA family protein [Anaerotignum propionicum]AMJ39969.1 colicin V production protein [Anaerotignum propionicum DSM 1682]SHE27049.1 Colicin V production protein [[Clostridium] propionicum DSM 1682] [Anaerotignum propionicum DSM 1682]